MKIKVGDIVLAGCHQAKAKVKLISGDDAKVQYVGGKNKSGGYTYPLTSLAFVRRPLKIGEEYCKVGVDAHQKFKLLSVTDGWALVQALPVLSSDYPTVTKEEYLYQATKEEEILTLVKDIENTMSLYTAKRFAQMIRKVVERDG